MKNFFKGSHTRYIVLFLFIPIGIIISCASQENLLKKSNYHYEYGLGYVYTENWAQAYEEFKKSAEINPKSDNAYFGLGLSLYFLGKFDESIQAYQKAIQINPNSPTYYNNMAASYAKRGDWDNVIKYSRMALDIPAYTSPEFAFYNIGIAYLNLGKKNEAVEFFKKSRDRNPNYIDTNLQLGKTLNELGDYQGSILHLKDAKRLEESMSAREPALQAEIDYYLGESFRALGDIDSAKAAFQAVLAKDPQGPFAEKALRHLQEKVK